jgi:hypothetical protein
MVNPIQVSIDLTVACGELPQCTMKLALTPDALGLRVRFRGLLLHYGCLEHPAFWDLGQNISLDLQLPCGPPPSRLVTTIYGVKKDGGIELVFRNWGGAEDGLPTL